MPSLDELRRNALAEAMGQHQHPQISRNAFEIHDIVRLSNGHEIIVTAMNPSRPANCWSGIKPRGEGKEYVFGPKHRPVKIGHAPDTHPALVAMRGRQAARGIVQTPAPTNEYKTTVGKLVEAVLNGDMTKAKIYAELVQELS